MFKWKGNDRLLFPAASPLFCFADLKPRISLALWNLCGVIHEQKHPKCGSHILGLKCDSPESLNILLMKAHSLCHRCLTDVCSFGCSTWDLTCIIYRSYFLPSGFSWRNLQKSYLIIDEYLLQWQIDYWKNSWILSFYKQSIDCLSQASHHWVTTVSNLRKMSHTAISPAKVMCVTTFLLRTRCSYRPFLWNDLFHKFNRN